MNFNRFLNIKSGYIPFLDSYVDNVKESEFIEIGTSRCVLEDVFLDSEYPEYLKMICKIVAEKEFNDVKVTTNLDKIGDITFDLYSDEHIPMAHFVSSIKLEFSEIAEIAPNEDERVNSLREFLESNNLIYSMDFQTQESNLNIEMFEEDAGDTLGIYPFKSLAYFFAGAYHKGINIKDIQQNAFFASSPPGPSCFIDSISASELLRSSSVIAHESITASKLKSLYDIALSGAIKIGANIEDVDVQYQSFDISKDSIISDYCAVLFKKSA